MNPRYSYFEKGNPFNEWHRTVDNLAAVDVDLMEVCDKCYQPLLLIEHAYDKGQTHKTCTAVMKLARQSKIPAILIFYKDMKTFRIRKLYPNLENERTVQASTLIRYLRKLHNLHKCI
tara:strand:+ start:128 stop:481 length:354 start_codon:yes stop_codon:yes gene_type:complete